MDLETIKHNIESILGKSVCIPVNLKYGNTRRGQGDFYVHVNDVFKKQKEKYGFNFIVNYDERSVKVWNID